VSAYDEIKQQIDQRIWDNRKISTVETATKMNAIHGKKRHKDIKGPTENSLI
jgi:hypothetical protein